MNYERTRRSGFLINIYFDVRKRLKQGFCFGRSFFIWSNMDTKEVNVLIADGSEASAMELKGCLEKGGYTVKALVGDGIDAVASCIKNTPDVIFLDSDLDLLDGFKTASCIRAKGYDGTVILLSDTYDESMLHSLADCGINGCVVKPVTEKFLIPWLHTKLTRAGDIKALSKEKEELLSVLEKRRLVEEANGLIAASKNISIQEADKILAEKAKAKSVTKEELARILVSDSGG